MTAVSTKELVRKTKGVFAALVKSKNRDNLTKQQILEILGEDYEDYYSTIVSGLAYIDKIIKKSGRTGGIQFKPGKARQRKLVPKNLKDLFIHFDSKKMELQDIAEASIDKGDVEEADEYESDLYEPLKRFLDTTGYFNIVEVIGNNRSGGGKWKNPDLVALNYSNSLKFHAGAFPRITAMEVKYQWPNIKDMQQTASYMRLFNSAYLCLLVPSYTGKDFNSLMNLLRDEEIWEWATLYEFGLIIAYTKQKRSQNYDFQIIKEAPFKPLDPEVIEEGITKYFSNETQKQLTDAVRAQIKQIS